MTDLRMKFAFFTGAKFIVHELLQVLQVQLKEFAIDAYLNFNLEDF
jgi:hypothetical protein